MFPHTSETLAELSKVYVINAPETC